MSELSSPSPDSKAVEAGSSSPGHDIQSSEGQLEGPRKISASVILSVFVGQPGIFLTLYYIW